MDEVLEELIAPFLTQKSKIAPHLSYLSDNKIIPHIIKYEDGIIYTEHIYGYRINQFLANNNEIQGILKYDIFKPESVKEILQIYENIGSICCIFNKIGIQHNDLECSNIIINEDTGEIYIIDWEYSKYSEPSFNDAHRILKNTEMVLNDYGNKTSIDYLNSLIFNSFFKGWTFEHDKIMNEEEKKLLKKAIILSKKYEPEDEFDVSDLNFI